MAEPAANSENGNGSGQSSELMEPRWAVISFERAEATGLTYPAAAAKLAELEAEGIPGLCVVADEAAKRVSG
ncbi:MAG: hypothetical protein QUS14_04305 [Pyrinomonadaceae bacterium]|nr:hypothetical protein [Pyrinomonadaceae bacterium]